MSASTRARLIKAAALGLGIAVAGLGAGLTPLGLGLEQGIGLSWLFQLRGPHPAPAEVVVVTIDRASSDQLGLSNKPRKWPRSLHAELISKLARKGAAVIAFDIIFEESRHRVHEQQLADAMREAGNVVLFQYLEKKSLTLDAGGEGSAATISIEKLAPPIPILADAAIALAPFPLPKVPEKVSQVFLFKTGANDIPTLPVTALQVFALDSYDTLYSLLQSIAPDKVAGLPAEAIVVREKQLVAQLARELRTLFLGNPSLKDKLLTRLQEHPASADRSTAELLKSLVTLYAGHADMYVNYYGPPHSITTIPYYRVLQADAEAPLPVDIAGKAVFVGFSEQLQPEQKDGFYTVYSQPSGLDISGVEIAATTFANLLARNAVLQPTWAGYILLFVLWGFLIGFILRLLPGSAVIPVALAAGTAYLGAAYLAFERAGYWSPIVTPLLWQLPLAIVGALLWRYLDVQREKRNIRRAFGYYLPPGVVDDLASGSDAVTSRAQPRYGICLATDAEQYTRLSEQLPPGELRDLMNRYYSAIFAPVRQAEGIVSDVVGDAMLAIWAARYPEPQIRRQACEAALGILAAVDEFNRGRDRMRLPTRLGMHCGDVVIGHVGALDHFEYRAVGDIVNTASRIEGLNKILGTRLLVSAPILAGLDEFVSRPLGRFVLAGKSHALGLNELVGLHDDGDAERLEFHARFAAALQRFQTGNWTDAAAGFKQCLATQPQDGPSQYYLHTCRAYEAEPPDADWDGTLHMSLK